MVFPETKMTLCWIRDHFGNVYILTIDQNEAMKIRQGGDFDMVNRYDSEIISVK